MDNDFNTPVAFSALFSLITQANKAITENAFGMESQAALREFFSMVSDQLGIVPPADSAVPDDVRALVDERQRVRESKDFSAADELRDRIIALGYSVDDTPYGPLVKKK